MKWKKLAALKENPGDAGFHVPSNFDLCASRTVFARAGYAGHTFDFADKRFHPSDTYCPLLLTVI